MKTLYSFPEDEYYELETEYERINRKKIDYFTLQLNKYFQNPLDKNNYYNLNYKE